MAVPKGSLGHILYSMSHVYTGVVWYMLLEVVVNTIDLINNITGLTM